MNKTKDIEAIFLDVGNTLRIVIPDEVFMRRIQDSSLSS